MYICSRVSKRKPHSEQFKPKSAQNTHKGGTLLYAYVKFQKFWGRVVSTDKNILIVFGGSDRGKYQ